jgi:hypothetical protein
MSPFYPDLLGATQDNVRYPAFLTSRFGPEFIFNYIALTENEKDPRNLVVAFSNIALICKGFDDAVIESYAEDLFDNFFCYFPVTFNQTAAAKKDPNAVTADDLKQGLRYHIESYKKVLYVCFIPVF